MVANRSVELNSVDTVVPFDDAVILSVAFEDGNVVRIRSLAKIGCVSCRLL